MSHAAFHQEFYPTPPGLAAQIAGDHPGEVRSVLDPSAGKGDLLAPFLRYRVTAYALEQSLELCAILREKRITVLGNDFLAYTGEHLFDLVVMNPPFSRAADHFLHAWNVCRCSRIIAILPKTLVTSTPGSVGAGRTTTGSLKNHTVCQIVEDHGRFTDLGQPFMDAERRTPVRVVKAEVVKPSSAARVFVFKAEETREELPSTEKAVDGGMVRRDRVGTLVGQYSDALVAAREMLTAMQSVRAAVGTLVTRARLDDTVKGCVEKDTAEESYNAFVDALKAGCWEALFQEGEFAKYMTSSCRKDFQRFTAANADMAFNEANIMQVMESLVMSNHEIFQRNIVDVFDYLTAYHEENRVHIEGWKTNDRWKVKRKFILPFIVDWDPHFGMSTRWGYTEKLRDIDTAMCTITGKSLDDIEPILGAVSRGCKDGWPVSSTFFKIRCYQKGTGHFEFIEDDLWNRFNQIACQGKNWLPE